MGLTSEDMIDDIMEAEIIAYILRAAAPEDDCLLVPVDDAGIGEPLFQGGLILPEDPIPAVLVQEIPPQEAEADADDADMDLANLLAAPEDNPEDPLIIFIMSDDEEDIEEEQEEWEEQEGDIEEELEDLEE
ncbi:hypothetical protein TIFTF001_031496 [Ficus carica]|uniref:Uncharacterized protein n=1 Tax=Ficus carica TaxID=3494 RepID=A0AA88DVJ3_FICCA|nr:hypothetical protein TIFTF001_031496 [Ficus carica]